MSIIKGTIKSGVKLAGNIKDDVIASTKLNAIHNVLNTGKNTEPFVLNVKCGVDLTLENPYTVHIKIKFNDLVFKKRISNIIKNNRYELNWYYTETNVGSMFKPRIERGINMHLEQGISPLTQLAVVVASFGFVDFADSVDNISLDALYDSLFHFKHKENSELFATKLETFMTSFLNTQLGVYEKLKSSK